jgi:2-methylisocitrate lyase-like PEP mutase family enzyme
LCAHHSPRNIQKEKKKNSKMPFDSNISTQLAQKLRSLLIPRQPLLLTNIWDSHSTSLALSNPQTKAIATASFAIAASAGAEDDELTLEDNLYAISKITARIKKEGREKDVPLTVDLQDGYGERLRDAVEGIVRLGAVGCNLEDARKRADGKMEVIDVEEHVQRVKMVVEIAKQMGVEGFVVNARTDCVLLGGTVEEAVERGQKYLEAGAATVFVWGGMKRGLRDGEVRKLVEALDGRVNVLYRKSIEGALSVNEIAGLGVARISMGPGLWREGMAAVEKEMGRIVGSYSDGSE